MESLIDYLDMLEDTIESAKSLPFSSKVSVDKENLLDIIGEIRLNMPNEIRQAQRIISDHDKIIKEAQDKAISMINEAHRQCEKAANEHEIYKKAIEQANELLDEAKQSARDVRLNAMSYADEILSKTETMLKEAMLSFEKQTRSIDDHFSNLIEVLYRNRKELKGENN
jgi:HrpE protein.